MGISVDAAGVDFYLDEKEYWVPKISDMFVMEEKDIPNNVIDIGFQTGMYIGLERDMVDSYFDPLSFQFGKEDTARFLDSLRNDKTIKNRRKSRLVKWLLSQKGNMIGYHENYFWSSSEIEEQKKHVWHYKKSVPVNEDGRLIMYAISNMEHLYDIKFDGLTISSDTFRSYHPDDIRYVQEEIINKDTIRQAMQAEEQLKYIQKQEDDKFFEERLERFKLVIDAAKQGAKLIYSV